MDYIVEKIEPKEKDLSVSTGNIFCYRAHIHSYYEIILYEPFCGNVTVNERKLSMKSYTCVMIAPWDLHKIEVEERTKANFIKIRVRSEVFDAKRSYPSFVLKKIESNDFLIAMFHELLQNGFSEQYVYHIVNAIVLQIISRGETVEGLKRGEKYRLALEAAKIVHVGFSFSISESDVAKRISISPQYLSKIFKQIFGVGFSEYLIDIRLSHVANLLIETEKSITEICYESGFGNFSHFLRSFKRKYHSTPREFRKNRSCVLEQGLLEQ